MSSIFNYNGTIGKFEDLNFNANNRAFKYGDGIIETIRVWNGKPIFLENHFDRIKKSADILKLEISAISISKLKHEICCLAKKSDVSNGKARLQILRNGQGAYAPETNSIDFLISINKVDYELFCLNKVGLKIGLFAEHFKHPSKLSFIKSCNAQIYVLAGIFTKKNNLDSCFILNSENQVIEALSSNIFVVKNEVIYTPPIKSGCIAGTMRESVLKVCKSLYVEVKIVNVVEQDLINADEIFLTNAIKGIEWVGAYKKNRYFNKNAKKISNYLINLSLGQ